MKAFFPEKCYFFGEIKDIFKNNIILCAFYCKFATFSDFENPISFLKKPIIVRSQETLLFYGKFALIWSLKTFNVKIVQSCNLKVNVKGRTR